MEEFSTNVTVENIYVSDHDVLRIVIEKNAVDFQAILSNPIWSGNGEEVNGFLDFLVYDFFFKTAIQMANYKFRWI